jgi:hypothetical protein
METGGRICQIHFTGLLSSSIYSKKAMFVYVH